MADHHQRLLLFLVFFSCFLCSSFAYQFVAGGRDGWVLNPSENYNHWAERNRFQVNDTILFKYKKGSDSVLVVNKDDYDKCNTGNPILKLDDGNSIFKFDRSGPFYFISGNKSNCDQAQKLIVVVMAVRAPPLPPTVPSPTAAPPTGAPAPSNSPPSPTPAGGAPTPASPSPSGGAPTPSSPSPSGGAPAPGNGGSAPSPSGSSATPGSPGASTPGSPGASTPGSPGSSTPGSGTPADVNGSPPPRRSLAAPSFTPSTVVISTVSLVLSRVVLGGPFMV